MKALFLKSVGNINIGEIRTPIPRDKQVLLKVRACALCRTDAKMWKMGHRDLRLPRILGHEICGIHEDTGKRYVVWPGNACGNCECCRNGYENLCDHMQITGFHEDGGLAEYTVANMENLLPVPDDLADELACMAEPLACTINAMTMADIQKGSKVLIYGAGPVGLMMALAIQIRQGDPTVVDINPSKIEISQTFQQKTGIRVTATVPENKWHMVINAAASTDTFKDGILRLVPGGSFCIFSGFINPNSFDPKEIIDTLNEIHYRQIRVSGAYGCTRYQISQAMDLLQNQPDSWSLLIEKIISLEEIPEVLPGIWNGNALKYVINFK